jgi:anti-anti-sigma factor
MTDTLQPALLTIDVRLAPEGRVVVHPCGSLDLATAPRLESTIDGLVASGHRWIDIDLGEVGFMDSSGLAVAARASRVVAALGGAVTISHATHRVRRLFDLVGAGHLLVGG